MKSVANVSRALRDLEWARDLWCNRTGGDPFIIGTGSSFDKHSADGNPGINKGGDDLVEM
jgi:hypothetical protein